MPSIPLNIVCYFQAWCEDTTEAEEDSEDGEWGETGSRRESPTSFSRDTSSFSIPPRLGRGGSKDAGQRWGLGTMCILIVRGVGSDPQYQCTCPASASRAGRALDRSLGPVRESGTDNSTGSEIFERAASDSEDSGSGSQLNEVGAIGWWRAVDTRGVALYGMCRGSV